MKKPTPKHLSIAISIALGLALPSKFSLAQQESKAEEKIELEKIEVTATRVTRSLQEVPVAVTAVSGDEIADNIVINSADLAQLVPSLTFTQSTGDINSRVQIRGIGTGVFASAVEPSVAFVIDGVVMGRQVQGFQDLVDIERVEVLRGPQSTLFGKNASAGVISITTKDPGFYTNGMAELIVAEGGERQLRGTFGTSLSDEWGVRLTGFARERDGHIDNIADGRDLNGFDTYGFRGKAKYEPSSDLSLSLIADYRKSENDCCQFQARDFSTASIPAQASLVLAATNGITPSDENTQVSVGAEVYNDTENAGLSGELNYILDNGNTFTSITAVRTFDYENNIDVDGVPGDEGTLGVVQINVNQGFTESTQFSQEFRIASPTDQPLNYVAGAYFFRLDLDRQFQRRIGAFVPQIDAAINQSAIFNGNVVTTNMALFGELNYDLSDKLSLLMGARFIDEKIEWDAQRDPANRLFENDFPIGGAAGQPLDIDDEASDTALTGRVGLNYQFDDETLLYGTYSRGYKGRGFNLGFTVQESEGPVDAEESDAFELGMKTSLLDNRLEINAALFTTDFKNFQSQVPLPGELAAILVNAGDVSTTGAELEFRALLTSDLSLSGGLTYMDAEIDEFPIGPCYATQTEAQGCINGTQDLAGGMLPNAPDLKYNISANYRSQLLDTDWELFTVFNYVWQDDVQYTLAQDPLTIQESYGIANINIGVVDSDEKYRISFFVRNLFDESFVTNIFRDVVVNGALSHYVPRDAERYAGVSFRYSFE